MQDAPRLRNEQPAGLHQRVKCIQDGYLEESATNLMIHWRDIAGVIVGLNPAQERSVLVYLEPLRDAKWFLPEDLVAVPWLTPLRRDPNMWIIGDAASLYAALLLDQLRWLIQQNFRGVLAGTGFLEAQCIELLQGIHLTHTCLWKQGLWPFTLEQGAEIYTFLMKGMIIPFEEKRRGVQEQLTEIELYFLSLGQKKSIETFNALRAGRFLDLNM